jgi:dienelactone hydrolase
VALLKGMPEIDAKHIFLVGFSLGAVSSLIAIGSKSPASHNGAVAGVIAYYPVCYDGVDPSVPVLLMIGEKDDWTPAAKCQAVAGKTNFEIVVIPALPMSSTLLRKSLATFWGITWSTMKRQRRMPNSALTPSWPHI